MFNNLLNSFHETVAEAKEDREQLDRLLTISTPRERLLVAAIAVFLCALLAWLFFGSVARSIVVDGVIVEQGQTLPDGSITVEALAWINSEIAPEIASGMPVLIEPESADGDTDAPAGTVRTIAAEPVSGGPAAFETAAPVSVHRIDIALETALQEDMNPDALAGMKCRIVIELGRQSPIGLFLMR
ncbi:MAG: hypothetical protein OXH56_08400 [Gemmatimonadetes bacterium]|nr:hypothetical protein [Gemmatimonadota bacterium]